MKNENFKLSIKQVLADRPFLLLMMIVAVIGVVYCFTTGAMVQPRDIKVYDRYTAFGEAHFYKNYWYDLIGFAVFGLIVTVSHLALMVKLHSLERRQTAIMFGGVTIVILLVAAVYGLAIMRLAFR